MSKTSPAYWGQVHEDKGQNEQNKSPASNEGKDDVIKMRIEIEDGDERDLKQHVGLTQVTLR